MKQTVRRFPFKMTAQDVKNIKQARKQHPDILSDAQVLRVALAQYVSKPQPQEAQQ